MMKLPPALMLVPLDAVHVPPIVGELEASQVFTKYAGSYAAAHESAPTTYTITSQMRVEFEALLKSENLAYSADSLVAVSHWIDARLRRELARRYAGDEAAYRVAVEDDEQVTAAAALVDKAPTLPELFTLVSQMNRVPGK